MAEKRIARGDWTKRFFCRCGDGQGHYASFGNPWFFSDDLCSSCGSGLRYSTTGRRVCWRGPRLGILKPPRKAFWEIHPDDDLLPFDTGGMVRHAADAEQ